MTLLKKYILPLLMLTTCCAHAQAALSDITFVILGASGDLSTRDLIPALFRLYRDKQLTDFAIVGAALPSIDKHYIRNQSQQFIQDYNQQEWDDFAQHFYYVSTDFNQRDFTNLHATIQQAEQEHILSGNRLIYCATSCDFFVPMTQALVQTNIITKQSANILPWHRIAYEKPFGYDAITAQNIENCANTLLNTTQIFHIDHFLMTHVMKNIPTLRFHNEIWQNQWNNNYIKQIDVLCKETLSVGNRGTFYDAVGSLLDVVQNHMFQMLALVAMEKPQSNDAADFQHERANVIKNTHIIDGFLGQYNGYKQEPNIPQDSTTDTFSALHLAIDTPRWQGVPFYLISGKHLDATEICIRITFKTENQLTFWIAPEPKMELVLSVVDSNSNPTSLTYHYPIVDSYSTDTYKNIFSALYNNNQCINVSFEEIQAAWNLIANIKKQNLPLYIYEQSSAGPIHIKKDI